MTNYFPSLLGDEEQEDTYRQQLATKRVELAEAQQQLADGYIAMRAVQQKSQTKSAEVEALELELASSSGDVPEISSRVAVATSELQKLIDEVQGEKASISILSERVDELELEVHGLRTLLGLSGIYSDDQTRALAAELERELREPVKELLIRLQDSDRRIQGQSSNLLRAGNKGLLSQQSDSVVQVGANQFPSRFEEGQGFTYNGVRYGACGEASLKWALGRLFRNAWSDLRRNQCAGRVLVGGEV